MSTTVIKKNRKHKFLNLKSERGNINIVTKDTEK